MKFKTLLILPLLVASLQAASVEDLTFTLNGDGTEYSVSDCLTSASGSLEIPSIYDDLPVTSIGDRAFIDCSGLTSITIPDSVTSIGDFAFRSCINLTSITFEVDAPTFGTEVFLNSGATIYYDPDYSGWSSTVAGRPAVESSPLTFTLNGDSTEYSVSDCRETASGSLEIPNTYNGLPVTSIGWYAFYNCTSLASITIPDSVTSIGRSAFSECHELASITIPDSVTSIGDYAFDNCTSLTNITIPGSVTSIGLATFFYCTSLTSITVPDSVTSIGGSAFRECSSLISITIGNSVTSIGNDAFRGCSSLTSVTFQGDIFTMPYFLFGQCPSATIYYDSNNISWYGISSIAGRPAVAVYATDTDGDGVGDNSDAFPNDPSETTDSDGDGVGDNADAFDNDPTESADSDGDGFGDNADGFPNIPTQDIVNEIISNPSVYNLYSRDGIQDLRTNSTILDVSNNQATIQIQMEESSDLESWSEIGDAATMVVPADSDTKFFRFKMTE